MSLLIGARGKSHIVVTGDGFSLRPKEDGGVEVTRKDLPKIFASESKPYVLAHHGQNVIGNIPCSRLLPEIIADTLDAAWTRGHNICVARAIEALDNSVSQHLRGLREQTTFGLWFAGFWPCSEVSILTELIWSPAEFRSIRTRQIPHGPVVIGGSGAKFIAELLKEPLDADYDARAVFGKPPEYAMEFIKRAYARAVKAQSAAGESLFGGTRRMAFITADGVDLDRL